MHRDTLTKAIGLVVLVLLAISQIIQLQAANRDRAEQRAQISALQAQVESFGGDPIGGKPNPGEVIIIDGERGPQGERGPRGEKGDRGPEGDAGEPGESGDPGADGEPGADGVDGVDGVDGQDGATGATGPAGPAGPPGATGAPGPTGPAGYPSSWTFTYVDRKNQTHTVRCSDPDGDRNYSCQEV